MIYNNFMLKMKINELVKKTICLTCCNNNEQNVIYDKCYNKLNNPNICFFIKKLKK